MDIRELTDMMDKFVRDKGWYEPNSHRKQTPKNLAISLVLEASELLELFQWRENIEGTKDIIAVTDELADISLYLLQIASILDINLESAIIQKLEKNSMRSW